jgi:hypothetical protein
MNNWLQNFIATGGTIQKALFLMLCGILFVFAVQVVFYLIIKLWPRKKDEPPV